MSTILITGGTGLTGRALVPDLLNKGYKVIILTRKLPAVTSQGALSYALWDVANQTIDVQAIREADYIIHLAGAPVVEKKWTAAYKQEIIDSRTKSSQLLVDSLHKYPNHVKAIVSASAIGWYGADKENDNGGWEGFTETDPPDNNFLGETCRLWEQSIDLATLPGIRLVKLRTGIVLSNHGGALVEFEKPLRFGVAGILGNGKQVVSWIHMNDLVKLYIAAIGNESMNGVYNAVAPKPVTNRQLTLCLAAAMNKKFFIPIHVPVFILRLILGQRSIEVLKSAKVSCNKLLTMGFNFQFNTIEAALNDLQATTGLS
jgi:uncharacterized protein (TIGR01777 family)